MKFKLLLVLLILVSILAMGQISRRNKSMIGGQFGSGTLTVAASTTVWGSIFTGGATGTAATEPIKQMPMPYAGTLRNFRVRTTSAQPAVGSLVFTVRKAGSDTSLVVTVPAGAAAGTFANTSNSVTFAAGDLIGIKIQNNDTGTTSATIISFSLEYSSP